MKKDNVPFVAEFQTLEAMINRCHNPNAHNFKHYGQRGISVCEEWKEDFWNFYRDVGPKPTPKHSIERKDVNGNYDPSNTCWATKKEQINNRTNTIRVEYEGRMVTISELADITGVLSGTLVTRYYQGDRGEKLARPTFQTFDVRGEELTVRELATRLGTTYSRIANRIRRGWSMEDILNSDYSIHSEDD